MWNPFKVGGFERRLIVFFLLLSVPPTLIIAFFSARYFMQSVRLVSNPGVEQSFTNSMEIARDLSARLEEDAGCAARRLRDQFTIDEVRANGRVGEARSSGAGMDGAGSGNAGRGNARLGSAAHRSILKAVGEETHADFTAIYTLESGPGGATGAGGARGDWWVVTSCYPADFQRIDSRIAPSPSPASDQGAQDDSLRTAPDEAGASQAGRGASADVVVVPFSDPDVIARGSIAGARLYVAGFALERGFADKIRGTADDLGRYRAVGLYVNVMRRYITIVTSVLVAIVAVASALLSRLIANRISHPITELARATERVAKGDLDYRVDVAARDEVLSLVNGFNKMTGDLQENRKNLILAAKREAEVARDFQIARQVQESLFPTAMPLIPGWEFAATCRTAKEVGGDYYDVFEVGPNKVLFAQGDVMGKSVGASLTMAGVHAIVRSAGLSLGEKSTPARLAEELNRYLIGSKTPDSFVTLFIGLIDADRDRLWYVNCGHPPALLARPGAGKPRQLSVGGMVLGIVEDTAFDTGECDLEAGDTLVLVSDGVTEAANPNGEMYGDEPLAEVVSTGPGLGAIENMQRVLDSVDSFINGAPQRDDISILVVRKAS